MIGWQRIVLGDLSQGCAAALHILLNFEGQFAVAEFVGMSASLLFRKALGPSGVGEKDHKDGGMDKASGFDDDMKKKDMETCPSKKPSKAADLRQNELYHYQSSRGTRQIRPGISRLCHHCWLRKQSRSLELLHSWDMG